jgi:hypothetical protein
MQLKKPQFSKFALGMIAAFACVAALAAVPGIFSIVNATTGYQVNGSAGTAGQALCSDGTYLDQFCSAFSLPNVGTPGTYMNLNTLTTDAQGRVSGVTVGAQSIASSGYTYLPGGLLYQWKLGTTDIPTSGRGAFSETWPISFPNACFNPQITIVLDSPVSSGLQGYAVYVNGSSGSTASTLNMYHDIAGDSSASSNYKVFISCIGN